MCIWARRFEEGAFHNPCEHMFACAGQGPLDEELELDLSAITCGTRVILTAGNAAFSCNVTAFKRRAFAR